jgi:DNA topoisomerase-1
MYILSKSYEMIGGKTQHHWKSLIHNGVLFPPLYIQKNIPVIVNNKEIILPKQSEEYALMYAKFIDSDYNTNNFKKNFWKDFKPTLIGTNINSLDEINFSLMQKYLEEEKENKKNITKEEKEKIKTEQDKIEEPYKYCMIDDIKTPVGNYKIEPTGIFLGRGNHPKSGRIKKRIFPEDIILNLSRDAPIPKINLGDNYKWGNIVHEKNHIWLATWNDNITGKNKYVFTSVEGIFKSKSDEDKFDIARSLKKKIKIIREIYQKELESDNLTSKQLGTALYFIDNFALRVGSSKDAKEEADTVGVTSLRIEHITLLENNTIKLDFLGKDSVRYCKKLHVSDIVYKNLILFLENKTKKEQLFDLINANTINTYLNSFLKGLTAKVWRTFNASYLFQKEIDKINNNKNIDSYNIEQLISLFNQANTEVALLCNHQKNINLNLDISMTKMNDKIKELKKKREKYKENKNREKLKNIEIKIKLLKLKKETKIKMKNVSLSTSKNNYIDPRIIFAFIKRYNIPPEKIFSEPLLKRFAWASNVDKDFVF